MTGVCTIRFSCLQVFDILQTNQNILKFELDVFEKHGRPGGNKVKIWQKSFKF